MNGLLRNTARDYSFKRPLRTDKPLTRHPARRFRCIKWVVSSTTLSFRVVMPQNLPGYTVTRSQKAAHTRRHVGRIVGHTAPDVNRSENFKRIKAKSFLFLRS
jgi:hypothetical protein